MVLSHRQLNRATLARQLLLERVEAPVTDVVRQVVALQAQEPPSPYIALWNRVADFEPSDLDAAFRSHQVVKSTLMRITLHAVHAEDYPVFHQAMQATLRAARYHDRRFVDTGVTPDEADGVALQLAEFATRPRSKTEVEEFVAGRIGNPDAAAWVWWALRQVGPFWHAASDETWSFGRRPLYVAAQAYEPDGQIDAVKGLIRRYLVGFGPASAQDIGQFALLRQSTVRPALAEMTDLVELEGPEGRPMFDVPGGTMPDEAVPCPPRLMAMWDSTLLAYKDRTRVIPEEYRRWVIRGNGDVLPTVMVDGHVGGVWRPADDGVEVIAFRAFDDDTWERLDFEASGLIDVLADRDPNTYKRYRRWWTALSGEEIRSIGT